MRQLWLSLLLFSPVILFAEPLQPVLNQVNYQASAEQWVNTQTAEVTISINATLNEEELAAARNDILTKLNQISASDWHITRFDRASNESGLEQLQVVAQTRLNETALSNLREKAKKVSKAGETYKIDSITFEPTLSEIENARKQLRNQLYQKVQDELLQLNKM